MCNLTIILVFSVLLALCECRQFKYPEDGTPCVMIDIDFDVELTAYRDGKVIARKTLDAKDTNITVTGACDSAGKQSELALNFPDKSKWGIAFQPHDPYPVGLYKAVIFTPSEAFGPDVDLSEEQTFIDPKPVYFKDGTHSYLCAKEESCSYDTVLQPRSYNFSVSVTIYTIHAQGAGLNGSNYGEPETCMAPLLPSTLEPVPFETTTPVKPEPFVSSTTPGPTTAQPKPFIAPVNTYNVKDGNTTCIAMETALTLIIKYPLNKPKLTIKEAVVSVPKDAIATGDCKVSSDTQTLSISFLSNWTLDITFKQNTDVPLSRLPTLVDAHSTPATSYSVSDIRLTFTLDEVHFPDCALPTGNVYTINTTSDDPNFPSTNQHSDFYRCDSAHVMTLTKSVKVKTEHLKFKAFNTDSNAEFTGKATECSSDSGSGGGLSGGEIVGIILLVLVAIALSVTAVVYVGRHRRRNNYDTIQ